MINRVRVEELAFTARDRFVFLCGSVENEGEVWDLFESVVCLVLDEAALRERLATRTTNEFGKQPVELAAVLRWNPTMEANYRDRGSLIVNTDQPLSTVVDEILTAIERRSA